MVFALATISGCASTPAPSQPPQPALAQIARAYAPQLAAAGVTDLDTTGRGAMVRAYTAYGTVYTRYPDSVASTRFVLHVDGNDVRAESDDFNAARAGDYAQALQAIVPETIRAVQRNNQMMFERANPDH